MLDGKKTLFSGMQATGNLTLGNYLGALKNWVTISDEYQTFFSVVDMHSITVRQDPAELRKGSSDSVYCGRPGSGKELYLLPVPCIGPCGARVDFKLLYLYGGVKPHDAV